MGIKDCCFASLFDKKDLPLLYKLAEKIRITHDQSLVDDFNLKCQKKIDDHNPILEIGNQTIEFMQVAKADDLIVATGINQIVAQIIGTSVTRWQYLGKGIGAATPTSADFQLGSEVASRVDMSLSGWREYASTTLRFGAVFGDTHANISVTEAGVFTASAGGTMLNRNVFSNSAITHLVNISCFVISLVVEFVPVMTF